MTRDAVLSVTYDRIAIDQPGTGWSQVVAPIGIQLEVSSGAFRQRVAPRFEVGAGVYVRNRERSQGSFAPVPLAPASSQTGGSPELMEAPFGLSMGGGASLLVSRRLTLDLDARYHQTMTSGSTEALLLTTVSLGLTYTFNKAQASDEGWVRSKTERTTGVAYAVR